MKSKRHKLQRLQAARIAGYRAWRKRDEADRLSRPPREPDPIAGAECIRMQISGPGWAHDVRCTVPVDRGCKRPRSDQYAVQIDGDAWAERAGLTALFRHLQSVIPRTVTRRQRDLMRR